MAVLKSSCNFIPQPANVLKVISGCACDYASVVVFLNNSRFSKHVEYLQCLLLLCRAHYSAGQIHALQHHWHQSEDCYRKCAQLAWDEQSKAQALYCLGVACHQQGRFEEALEAYDSSLAVNGDTSMRPMLVLSRVRALRELGRDTEAEGVAEEFLASDQARLCSPVVVDAIARRGRIRKA